MKAMCTLCDQQSDRVKADIAPSLAALLAGYAARGLVTPDPAQVGITAARQVNEAYFRAIAEPKVAVASTTIVSAKSPDGHEVPVKVVLPLSADSKAPAILYCHGGGYAFGDIHTHDPVICALAASTGLAVFALDYRRTPEQAHPAQLDDALVTLAAMRSTAWSEQFGHDQGRILVLGDSAGAHLALMLMLALKRRGLPQLAGAALIYGMYARRFDTWSHHAYGDGSRGLSTARMRWFWEQLLKGHPDGIDTLVEPLDADLAGLPRLALFAAEVDCLLDDTLDFRETCKRQDHPHTFDLFRAMPHAFFHLVGVHEDARTAMALVAARLKQMLE